MNNNRFSLTWIKEREFYDKQSRSNLLTMEIKKDSKNVKKIIDLGCGTGAFLRWCITEKILFDEATLIDYDKRLLRSIDISFRRFLEKTNYFFKKINPRKYLITNPSSSKFFFISFLEQNILNSLNIIKNFDLISLSALSDLLSKNFIRKLFTQSPKNKYIYFSLCFNGKIKWSPVSEFDKYIVSNFNNHQLQDKGFGNALGKNSLRYIESIAKKKSYVYLKKDSPWKIGSSNKKDLLFQKKYLNMMLNTLKNDGRTQKDILKPWYEKRVKDLKRVSSKLVVGHNDILIKT